MAKRRTNDTSTDQDKPGVGRRPPLSPITIETVHTRLVYLQEMMALALRKLADLNARVSQLADDADEEDAISKGCGEAMKLYFASEAVQRNRRSGA